MRSNDARPFDTSLRKHQMRLFTQLIQNVIDDAGCWVWQKACSNGHPAFRKDGKPSLVRREIWKDMNGEIPAGKIIHMTCETNKCVHPEHMVATTYKEVAKKMGKIGLMSGPVRSAKIAATKREKYAKLTHDSAMEIRSSNETGKALAEKYQVSQAHISKIQLGKCWKQFSSPWAGLSVSSKTTSRQ